jgi:hypothetical protein
MVSKQRKVNGEAVIVKNTDTEGRKCEGDHGRYELTWWI